jgi:hypothetical protein
MPSWTGTLLAPRDLPMEIRLISTLTPEDETRLASTICAAVAPLLDHLSIAYTLRIETTDGQTFHHHSAPAPVTRVSAIAAES